MLLISRGLKISGKNSAATLELKLKSSLQGIVEVALMRIYLDNRIRSGKCK